MVKGVHRLSKIGIRLSDSEVGGVIAQNMAYSCLVIEVREKQFGDSYLLQMKEGIHEHKASAFEQGGDGGTMRYRGRLYILDVDGLREWIMSEDHNFSIGMALFETLFERSYRSPIGWFKFREVELLGLDLVYQAMEKRDLEFEVNDWVFLKLSPMKGGMRFVFHVSMLRKCVGDPSLIVPTDSITVNDNLTYEGDPVKILDHHVHKLRTEEVASVKVLWRSQKVEEATWETEEDMKSNYPYLFEESVEINEGIVPSPLRSFLLQFLHYRIHSLEPS
ncbi:uncharacterized protein LOC132044898 [Lycium ferocissimum]|uniref:uncharacterized protein LOC132044898 n=1 Tax=Lycium ferocissimum TaxID=112874 RepID=UPI002814BAE4|nr:uncharacterized protein LOC132044898 [Lycium ferocissimum]